MSVGYEKGLSSHKAPGAGTKLKPQLQFGDTPVTLHRSARVPLDRQPVMGMRLEREVVDHQFILERVVRIGEDIGSANEVRQCRLYHDRDCSEAITIWSA